MTACIWVEVMKMGIHLEVPISKSTDLKEFQKKVADEYWKHLGPNSRVAPHGDPQYVGISTDSYLPIETDRDFQEYKDLGRIFNAKVNHSSLRN